MNEDVKIGQWYRQNERADKDGFPLERLYFKIHDISVDRTKIKIIWEKDYRGGNHQYHIYTMNSIRGLEKWKPNFIQRFFGCI